MPMNYSHTRDFVAIRPIPSPSHVGLKVTARSSTPVYTCESPSRKEVAKQNYERRDYQTSSCGYRSVNHKPYREVGEVILDERELILRALGQYSGNEKDNREDDSADSFLKQLNPNANESRDVIAISQPKIEDLQTLDEQLRKGSLLLNKVKLGIDLFRLIREEQRRKVLASENERIKHEIESKTSMRTAEDTYDNDEDDDAADLSKYVLSPLASKRNTVLIHRESSPKIVETSVDNEEPLSDADVSNTHNWDYAESDYTQNGTSHLRHPSKDECNTEIQNSRMNNRYQIFDDKNTAKVKVSKSKKFKSNLPRPFSPIFTNVNFYETQSREHTFRQLCALHWILEAMSLDQPASMPPISTCWNLKELKQDLTPAQLKADRDKAIEPIWRTFLSNPKRFTRGKTGKRGALLQRRVSIAPNALRRMSSGSNVSQASGSKQSTLGDDLRSPHATPTDPTKQGRNKSASKTGLKGDESPDSVRRTVSDRQSADPLEEGLLQQTPISVPSLKEKAFIVREVVVARNVFGRRESKFNKARPSISKEPKESSNKKKKNKNGYTSATKPVLLQEPRQMSSSEPKSIATNKHRKSLAGGSSVIDPGSPVSVNETLPYKLKETFEELAAENALVLHDQLEQREKTSIESMERKFHALHVMSDVNKAISAMRSKSRLKVETDEEKKARFSEECSWYKSLLENLPSDVRDDNYNALVLDKIAKYGSLEGRKISSSQFIKVLSTLRPWELCYPDISAAIEFVRDKIVEMDKTEFEAWFQSRIGEPNYLELSFNKSEG